MDRWVSPQNGPNTTQPELQEPRVHIPIEQHDDWSFSILLWAVGRMIPLVQSEEGWRCIEIAITNTDRPPLAASSPRHVSNDESFTDETIDEENLVPYETKEPKRRQAKKSTEPNTTTPPAQKEKLLSQLGLNYRVYF